LHDLAVVIRGDRIVAANVQLPLADASLVPARLGSRHQAALGVALDTDAVVVTVSEQTGEIRISSAGKLSDPIAYDDFAGELRRALVTNAEGAQVPAAAHDSPDSAPEGAPRSATSRSDTQEAA
jgi:diadenylate cyclase